MVPSQRREKKKAAPYMYITVLAVLYLPRNYKAEKEK